MSNNYGKIFTLKDCEDSCVFKVMLSNDYTDVEDLSKIIKDTSNLYCENETDEIILINEDKPLFYDLLNKKIGDFFELRLTNDNNVVKYEVIDVQFDKTYKLICTLKDLGFDGLIHMTELKNFENIVNCGFLYPRKYLIENKIKFSDSANNEVLNRTEEFVKSCCRFYYYYKTPTYYSANYSTPIILVFDEKLLYRKRGVFFSDKNACQSSWTNNIDKALNFDWDGIFERVPISKSKFYNYKEPYDDIKQKIKTVRNAEILLKESVSIEFIKQIIVKDFNTFECIKKFCDKNLLNKVKVSKEEFFDDPIL